MKITQDYLSAIRLDGGFLIGVALRNGITATQWDYLLPKLLRISREYLN